MTIRDLPAEDASARPAHPVTSGADGVTLITVLLLAFNLRPVMAGLGPLLDLIEADAGMTSAQAGLLTTLPVFCLGLGAFAGVALRRRFGTKPVIAAGIATIALACASRAVWRDAAGLLTTAAAAGTGVAVIQALLPAVVKQRFGSGAGRAMALYITAVMGGAACAAATASGLARALDWPGALAVWALPAAVATIGWLALPPAKPTTEATPENREDPIWRKGRAWTLMLFFGIGTSAYTLILAWLPPYYMSLGQSRDSSGYLLAGLTLAQVVAGLGVSAVIGRFPDRRGPLAGALLGAFAGLVCLAASPVSLAAPAALLLGLGIGALFPLTLIVTLDHADGPNRAAELAAFVQGGGYIVASLAPFVAGAVRDRFADLSGAWEAMAVAILFSIAIAGRLSPDSCRLLSRE